MQWQENFALSFSLKFLSIFMHISGSIEPITVIWVSMERSFLPAEVEYRWRTPKLVKGDDITSETKAKAHHFLFHFLSFLF